jgi:anaerobic selenocysteine-containing dehydrogenase
VRGKLVQVEPRMSLTGANADEWVPARPGTEGVLALGLAHVIITDKLRRLDAAGKAGTLVDGWSGGLTEYTPAQVEQRTGVSAARITRLAHEMIDQSPAVAIIGGAPLAHTNGLFQALAVNALNALVGSVDQPGGVSFMPEIPSAARRRPGRSVPATIAAILAEAQSPVQVLLVDGVNPVYASPAEAKVRDALVKVPYIVSFASFHDDTSVLADLVLPDHAFLEAWTDAPPESGARVAVPTLAPPAMPPLYQTRATGDVLLDLSRRLKKPLAPALTGQTFEEALQASFATLAPKGTDADDLWSLAQMQGGWWGELKTAAAAEVKNAKEEARRPAEPQFNGDVATYPFHFLPYASQALLDGSVAHLPWLQELPDPMTTAMWSNWVDINNQTAARLGITDGDIVEIVSPHGTVRAPAVVSPGIAPDVIGMPVGQGHETFTRYASGRGSNPIKILAPVVEPETGALAWAATRVRVAKVGGPDGSLVAFAGGAIEHPEHKR